ncbi:hypothetical protein [Kribbella antiqua]|nr:hypothetical protein [Kribbella antiqua]
MTRYHLLWMTVMGLLAAGGVMLALLYVNVEMTAGICLMAAAVGGSIYFNVAWPRRKPGQSLSASTVLAAATWAAIAVAVCGYWIVLAA